MTGPVCMCVTTTFTGDENQGLLAPLPREAGYPTLSQRQNHNSILDYFVSKMLSKSYIYLDYYASICQSKYVKINTM